MKRVGGVEVVGNGVVGKGKGKIEGNTEGKEAERERFVID